jgi:hypothetical protein
MSVIMYKDGDGNVCVKVDLAIPMTCCIEDYLSII